MNGFRSVLLSHALFATDDSGGGSAPVVEAVPLAEGDAAAAPAAEPAEPETTSETKADTPPEPEKEPWQKVRISEITRQRHEAERRAEMAERRMRELEAKLAPPQPAQDPNQPERLYTRAELEREATTRAQQLAEQQTRSAAIQRTLEAGATEYTPASFNAACNTLADLGANDKPDFLALVADLPNGHAVLQQLGSDPDAAMRILAMPPTRMALELGRVSAAAAVKPAAAPPAPKPVSKAPPPVEPIAPRGQSATETDPDRMNVEQYAAWWAKRHARA